MLMLTMSAGEGWQVPFTAVHTPRVSEPGHTASACSLLVIESSSIHCIVIGSELGIIKALCKLTVLLHFEHCCTLVNSLASLLHVEKV